jgi:hypothetical protein
VASPLVVGQVACCSGAGPVQTPEASGTENSAGHDVVVRHILDGPAACSVIGLGEDGH